jgi:hypothetical protein
MAGEDSATRIFGAFVEAARRHAEERKQVATDLSPAGSMAAE